MGVGQLSESDAVDALRLPFYSSSHPTGSHGWRIQFDLGNPDLGHTCQDGPHVIYSSLIQFYWIWSLLCHYFLLPLRESSH